jgi:hypothetical protein
VDAERELIVQCMLRMDQQSFANAVIATLALVGAAPRVEPEPLPDPDAALRESVRRELLDTPELRSFSDAVTLESLHQRDRWGSKHDAGKEPADWFWLLGYLGGKALKAAQSGDTEKALHHCVSSAAVLANWHAALLGTDTSMRPGIERPVDEDRDAANELFDQAVRASQASAEVAALAEEMATYPGGDKLERIDAIQRELVGLAAEPVIIGDRAEVTSEQVAAAWNEEAATEEPAKSAVEEPARPTSGATSEAPRFLSTPPMTLLVDPLGFPPAERVLRVLLNSPDGMKRERLQELTRLLDKKRLARVLEPLLTEARVVVTGDRYHITELGRTFLEAM